MPAAPPDSPIVLVGTMDTKAAEYGYLRERLEAHGLPVLTVDVGVLGTPGLAADVGRDAVAAAAGTSLAAMAAGGQRGPALAAMATGAAAICRRLHDEGRLGAIVAIGGSGAATVAGAAMQALPFGVPKLLVTTMAAAGDTRPFVGTSDIMLMNPVVDIAGLNRLSRDVLARAAAAVAGMVQANASAAATEVAGALPRTIGATMFGVTTPGVTAACRRLEELGYEVLVFHANGVGGRSLEHLAASGRLDGVLDLTTTELADDLVGGVAAAGPDRLCAAGAAGIPQVVGLGALDVVNFGARDDVPAPFADRVLYEHNPTATLMRTSAAEGAELGRRIAAKLNTARGAVEVIAPTRGLSALSVAGGAFHDPEADAALLSALRAGLDERVVLTEMNTDINDPSLGRAAAEALHRLLEARA